MICRNCGSEFEPKKRGRKNTGFCCKKCADNWRQHNVYDLLPKRYKKVCQHCGEEFETNRENQKYCSLSCSSSARRISYRAEHVCRICGRTFVANAPNEVLCSEECRHRAKRQHEGDKRRRRRVKTGDQRDSKISLDRVYNQANGICCVCGLPVPLHCDSNDVWSRTRDHIIPIALDGDHSYSNCQLTHRICNSMKGVNGEEFRIDWEQRFEADPEKWEKTLARLDELLCIEHQGIMARTETHRLECRC